jgi:type VI protein secretion system component VasK
LNLQQSWKKLLDDPIIHADALAKNALPNQLNGKGNSFCAAIRPLLGKFPFNWSSEQNARIDEVAEVFQQPGGRLWTFYAETLQQHLVLQGNKYVPTGKVTITPEFLRFFDRAAEISRALFAGPSPGFSYTVQTYPSPDIEIVSLRIDGGALRASGNRSETQEFAWPGDGSGAVLEVKAKRGSASMPLIAAPWAPFRLMAENRPVPAAGPGVVEVPLQPPILGVRRPSVEPLAMLRLGFRSAKVPSLFSRDFFALRCEPRVAR